MTEEDIYLTLRHQFGEGIAGFTKQVLNPFLIVSPSCAREVFETIKDNPIFKFDSLMCMSGVDTGTLFELVYHLYSMEHSHRIVIKVGLTRENPYTVTVSDLWRTADWHEREIYDMFGIIFEGHPNLCRILCPEDWEGYPLRKDYVVQEMYHGMRVSYPRVQDGRD